MLAILNFRHKKRLIEKKIIKIISIITQAAENHSEQKENYGTLKDTPLDRLKISLLMINQFLRLAFCAFEQVKNKDITVGVCLTLGS